MTKVVSTSGSLRPALFLSLPFNEEDTLVYSLLETSSEFATELLSQKEKDLLESKSRILMVESMIKEVESGVSFQLEAWVKSTWKLDTTVMCDITPIDSPFDVNLSIIIDLREVGVLSESFH